MARINQDKKPERRFCDRRAAAPAGYRAQQPRSHGRRAIPDQIPSA